MTITITRRMLRLLILWAFAACIAWLVFFQWIPRAQYRAKLSEAKQNLHAVQLALERFAVDNDGSYYPVQVEELLSTGYLSVFPLNPFTGEPMQPIHVDQQQYNGRGTLRIPGARRGDFVYYPRYSEYGGDKPAAYTLFLY